MSSKRFSNRQIAEQFRLIADLLEIRGDVIYKILAYRKAAESLRTLGRDVNDVWGEGVLQDVPGIGKAIAEKIDELLSSRKLEFLEELKAGVPVTLAEILQVPGLGPKKVAMFWRQAGIVTLAELATAARAGRLRRLPGMGPKSEAKILAGIAELTRRTERTPLGEAWPVAQQLLELLRDVPGVQAAEAVGSLRRMQATIGGLDLLVSVTNSVPVMEVFVNHLDVERVLSHGKNKSSVEFSSGLRAQLCAQPPERFGTALQYATGSKDHNVRLRELSLSEHALAYTDRAEILCATEAEVYETLGLPWIPPELREDLGEVQAARAGALPELLECGHVLSELHAHTIWSDGQASIETMALEARSRGLKFLAITDHSYSLGVANGLTVERLRQQRAEIDAVQGKLGDSISLLAGVEVEIRADGSLDFDDEVLAELDLVVASLHMGLRQPRERVTQRLLNAIRNPHVDIIGHPSGRRLPDREPADVDMDAVLAAASKSGVALEINANPARLDLEDIYARRAVESGVILAVNTDAHRPEHFDLLHFGVATARRAWVAPKHTINTWSPELLLGWLGE